MILYTLLADITPIGNPVISGFAGKRQEDTPGIFGTFIGGLIGLFLIAASIWAFFQLLQAGLAWISSGGDKAALESAQKRFTNAVIGLFIVFASWAIFLVLMNFLGITTGEGLNFVLPTLF